MKLEAYCIKGERCSGTNYLEKLIEINLKIQYNACIAWKHGFYSPNRVHSIDPSDYLTIIISRNPFDWVRSVYLNPHHFKNTSEGVWKEEFKPTFSQFLKNEIDEIDKDEIKNYGKEGFRDRHPLFLTKAKNILQLRNWKTEHFLALKNILPNTYYVKYEELAENPEKIIRDINDKWFNVEFEFQNYNNYKHHEDILYTPKTYFDISDEDYNYIVKNIDWELESKIGYSL